jgi:hypothetical protein
VAPAAVPLIRLEDVIPKILGVITAMCFTYTLVTPPTRSSSNTLSLTTVSRQTT